MDAMKVAGESAIQDGRDDGQWRARRPGRSRMFKPAQIAFGGSVLDCALLDLSLTGARVQLLAPAEVPEIATLRFPGGEARTVRRRWKTDAQVGLEFVGTATS